MATRPAVESKSRTSRGPARPQYSARAYRLNDPAIARSSPGSPIPFTLTTPGAKRDGQDLATLPFSVERYSLNPVVLAFHRYDSFPIGRGEIEVVGSARGEVLLATAWFDIEDEIGRLADRKYREGFMFAVSLGWDDIDDHGIPIRASKRRAVARDVLEFSIVAVPADWDATIDIAGDDLARTRSFMTDVRDLLQPADPRARDVDEVLRRLAACAGDDCPTLPAGSVVCVDDQCRVVQFPGASLSAPHDPDDTDEGDARAQAPDAAEALPPAQGEADEVDDTEARRRAAMAAMVAAVWVDDADDANDADRDAARKALLPEYRRLGLTPPAFLPASVVAALPNERRAALFVNGEIEEIDMTTLTTKGPASAGTNGASRTTGGAAATGERAGATLSKTTRSTIEGAVEQLDAARKTLRGLLDSGSGGRTAERSCGCGSGSSHTSAQTVHQASGEATATTLEAELARLSEMFPGVEFAATVPDGEGGSRGLVGIDSLQEAADESEILGVLRPAAELPADLKQIIADEAAAQIAAGPGDEPVALSLNAWLQDPEYPFEPGTKAIFQFDLTPEMAERIKAAALGLEQPEAEEPEEPAEEEPAEEPAAEGGEVTEADETASATAPDTLTIDADTLALFEAAVAGD